MTIFMASPLFEFISIVDEMAIDYQYPIRVADHSPLLWLPYKTRRDQAQPTLAQSSYSPALTRACKGALALVADPSLAAGFSWAQPPSKTEAHGGSDERPFTSHGLFSHKYVVDAHVVECHGRAPRLTLVAKLCTVVERLHKRHTVTKVIH